MKRLVYFVFADIMALVEYEKKDDMSMLSYSTHRELDLAERMIIDLYILQVIALDNTDFYKSVPGSFAYIGKNSSLVKHLDMFHRRSPGADAAVNRLMKQHYFELIGDTIPAARKDKKQRIKLGDLVKEYNRFAEKKVTVESVLKSEKGGS